MEEREDMYRCAGNTSPGLSTSLCKRLDRKRFPRFLLSGSIRDVTSMGHWTLLTWLDQVVRINIHPQAGAIFQLDEVRISALSPCPDPKFQSPR